LKSQEKSHNQYFSFNLPSDWQFSGSNHFKIHISTLFDSHINHAHFFAASSFLSMFAWHVQCGQEDQVIAWCLMGGASIPSMQIHPQPLE